MRALSLLVIAACGGGGGTDDPMTNPQEGPPAGWVDGHAQLPAAAQAEDVSSPTTVISDCTSDAVVAAVAKGGVITFDCGADPVTITMTATAKVFNDKGTKLVIDGGNRVTLSGGGARRILYMATCDKTQVYPPVPATATRTRAYSSWCRTSRSSTGTRRGSTTPTITAAAARSTRKAAASRS